MSQRRFPLPSSAEEQSACLTVRDAKGQQLAYVYFVEESGSSLSGQALSKSEMRRIAAEIVSVQSELIVLLDDGPKLRKAKN